MQEFLEAHPSLLPGGTGDIGPGGHHGSTWGAVITQPSLEGVERDRRPDFMWVTRSTSLITPICIEIEKPGKRWFTQNGRPTAHLTQALDQLTDWKVWFSEPENELLFRRTYLIGDEWRHRQLLPQCVLIFGRRHEFENPDARANAGRLRRKRDFMLRSNESFMTFDSLSPNERHCDALTLKVDSNGPKLWRLPPSFTLGPVAGKAAAALGDPLDAVKKTELWSEARRKYVRDRWNYWAKAFYAPREVRTYDPSRGE
ncbi:hypothetical protein ASG41_12505 [Modestobacter sp. Leaf380]|nr:hypothetical protein ASG41_12505 [Modestobacter sp. Leaf380]